MLGMTGEIRCFMGRQPPAGWTFCRGQCLGKVAFALLFQEIGFRFGKMGDAYFKLPDLEGQLATDGVAYGICLRGFSPDADVRLRLGEVCLFAGSSSPAGRLICDGSLKEIKDYEPLFSVLGHQFGGEKPSFQLPDLRGKGPHDLLSFSINAVHQYPQEKRALPVEEYVGEIRLFASPNLPKGWIACEGQRLSNDRFEAINPYLLDSKGRLQVPDLSTVNPTNKVRFGLCTKGIFPVQM